MSRAAALLYSIGLIGLLLATPALAEEKATADEIVTKVKEAAAYIAKEGDKAIAEFQDIKSAWAWKDTYIFVLKCSEQTAAAHMASPKMVGADQSGLADKRGNYFFLQFCDVAEANPEKGGWVEYWWPKKDQTEPSRKVSYVLQVPGQPFQVGAGVYSDDATADQLNARLK